MKGNTPCIMNSYINPFEQNMVVFEFKVMKKVHAKRP